MYSDCRGCLQHKGSFGFVQNAEKTRASRMFFFTETSNTENKATVYLIFTDMPARTSTSSSSHFYSWYITLTYGLKICVILRLSDWHPLPSLLSILKDFPVRQYHFPICPSPVPHGGHFYACALFLNTARTQDEINLCGAPYGLVKTLLVHMIDVISVGSGEHVCLHNLVRVSFTNKV